MANMKEKYGDDWEYEMDDRELRQEKTLLANRERFEVTDEDQIQDIAFDLLVGRYGDDFNNAFYNRGSELVIYNEFFARSFLGEPRAIHETRLKYTTEGLTNKREICLTVPSVNSWHDDNSQNDLIHFGDADDGRAIAWVRFGDAVIRNFEKVLVIDEIQSKRHQEGRRNGYINISTDGLRVDRYDDERGIYHISDSNGDTWEVSTLDAKTERDALQVAAERRYRASADNGELSLRGIPAAPFEKNWQELAMKRMLRYAAENGYDRVAWLNGLQQAERYSLGGMVESIYFNHSRIEPGTYSITVFDVNANVISSASPDSATEEEVRKLFGKDITDQLLQGLADLDKQKDAGEVRMADSFHLEGTNLEIGGEGMKAFYDKMLPVFMNKYGKQWGIHVEDLDIPQIQHEGTSDGKALHSVRVTGQMRQDVMEGQPMFFRNGEHMAYGFVHHGIIYIDPRIATAETPLHEYTHLWAEVLRQRNPQEWQHIVQMMKDTPEVWNYVKRNYSNLRTDDQIADEALAQFSGKRGYRKLQELVDGKQDADTIFGKMMEALGRFWSSVAEFFGIHYTNKEEVADRILYDLLSKVNPLDYKLEDIEGLQESQEARTESHNFKTWFGDWQNDPINASKVVDADGKPLVVEHATRNQFTKFDISHLGENSLDKGAYGSGFYFGTHAPGWMEGARVMQVYLDIKHPFELVSSMSHLDGDNIYSYFADRFDHEHLRSLVMTDYGRSITVGEYIDAVRSIDHEIAEGKHDAGLAADKEIQVSYKPSDRMPVYRERLISDRTGFMLPGALSSIILDLIGSEPFTEALQADGFDGVIVDRGEDYKEYVAFEPSQIKSATDNIGLYSRDNADIRLN